MDSYDDVDQQIDYDNQQVDEEVQQHGFVSPPTGEDVRFGGVEQTSSDDYPTLPAAQPHQVQTQNIESDEPTVGIDVK